MFIICLYRYACRYDFKSILEIASLTRLILFLLISDNLSSKSWKCAQWCKMCFNSLKLNKCAFWISLKWCRDAIWWISADGRSENIEEQRKKKGLLKEKVLLFWVGKILGCTSSSAIPAFGHLITEIPLYINIHYSCTYYKIIVQHFLRVLVMHLKMTIMSYFWSLIFYHFEIREYFLIKLSEKQGLGPGLTLSFHLKQGLVSLSGANREHSIVSSLLQTFVVWT